MHREAYQRLKYLVLVASFCACKTEVKRETSAALADIPDDTVVTTVEAPDTTHVDYDTTEWTELLTSETYILDLRYATKDNFTKAQIYPCARCFVRPQVQTRLEQIYQTQLKAQGLKFKLYDCYRPRPAQQKLWDIVPNATYVAHPQKGSMHNKGLAVDLTLCDKNGKELEMGTDFDFFGRAARHNYTELDTQILNNRKLLKSLMEKAGFKSIKSEWWHYSLTGTGLGQSDWEWPCPK